MNTDGNCGRALGNGLRITTITGHTRRWATLRPVNCIVPLNHTERNRQVGLEVRPPVVVKKNHPRKREGGSGAVASFLLAQYLGEQRNDGQLNRPSAPESHSLFSAISGLKMGTSSFHELTVDVPGGGGAEEEAFFLGAVVVRPLEGAAAAGGDVRLLEPMFSKPVMVAAIDRLSVEVPEVGQQRVGVERPHGHAFAEREMGEHYGRLARVVSGKVVVQPGKRRGLDARVLVTLAVGGVEGDELPTVPRKVVIEAAGKGGVVRAPIGVRDVIIIAGHSVGWHAELAEGVAHRCHIVELGFVSQVAGVQAERGAQFLHLDDGTLQIRHTLWAEAVSVVDD